MAIINGLARSSQHDKTVVQSRVVQSPESSYCDRRGLRSTEKESARPRSRGRADSFYHNTNGLGVALLYNLNAEVG